MQRLEVSGVVRLIYRSLGVKGLNPVSVASLCHTTRSSPSVQFCPDAVQPVTVCGLLRLWRPVSVLQDHLAGLEGTRRPSSWQRWTNCWSFVQQLWSCHLAVQSALAGQAWIRLPRFLATDLDGFNKQRRQIVPDSSLLINKLPHYERCSLIWHHETNLATCKCKQF